MEKQGAVLDTSFWSAAFSVELLPYLFDFFQVRLPQAVIDEITAVHPQESTREFPQAALYRVLQDRFTVTEPHAPLRLFGPGERHAIALAVERSEVLLINDYKPYQFARRLGVRCLSVPEFAVLVFAAGKLSQAAIKLRLARLRYVTSKQLIDAAEEMMRNLAEQEESGDTS